MTPTRLMEELAWGASLEQRCGSSTRRTVQRALQKGEPIPEYCLPGRAIMRLKPEQREILSRLGSNMIQDTRKSFIELVVE